MPRKHTRWTEEEDELIREHYPEHGGVWDGWSELMPERMPTPETIYARAYAIRRADRQALERAEAAVGALSHECRERLAGLVSDAISDK